MSRRRVILGAVLLVGLSFVSAGAYAATWTGRSSLHGYFDNNPGGSCTSNDDGRLDHSPPYPPDRSNTCAAPVLPHRGYSYGGESGLSLNAGAIMAARGSGNTAGNVAAAHKFADLLRDTYNNNGWSQTGVAFIVDTMLGRDPNDPGTDRSVSSAEFDKVEDSLVYAAQKGNVDFKKQIYLQSSPYNGKNSFYQRYRNDVAWYPDDSNEHHLGMVVYNDNNQPIYALWYYCGNPLGNLNGLPPPPVMKVSWSVSTGTAANVTAAQPGDTITWTHTVTNNGPNAISGNVTYRYDNGGDLNAPNDTDHPFTTNNGPSQSASFSSSYVVKASDVGKTLCRRTTATPRSSADGSATSSAQSCVSIGAVAAQYSLHPAVTFAGNLSTTVEPGGQTVSLTPAVTNDGPTSSGSTVWQLTKCTYAAGAGYPQNTDETTNTRTAALTFGGSCSVVQNGTDTYATGQKAYDPYADTTNASVGQHVCFILSVNPPATGVTGWRHSAPACAAVLKVPKVQVRGGDLYAGSVETAPPSQLGGVLYGSWAQYGIIGVAGISGMGSAGAYADGASAGMANRTDALTFANPGSGSCALGCFYAQAPGNAYFQTYSDLRTATRGPTAGGTIAKGARDIIYVEGNLTVTGNLTYDGPYASPADIPRVIYVVHGNVTVSDGVTRIDPWIIASGTLYTCASYTGGTDRLSSNICNQRLTFNGPVYVANTVLGRTAGADADSRDEPAEVFNLSPGNYLGNYSASVTAGNIRTVYEKELPPRW